MSPLLLLLACSPQSGTAQAPTTLDATGIEGRRGGPPGQPVSDFEPSAITLDGWTGIVDGELVAADGDTGLVFTFWTERGWNHQDLSETCSWEADYEVVGSAGVIDDDIWTTAEVRLLPASSDCAGLDPATWGEDTPTTALLSTPLAIGFGPMSQDLHGVMTAQYDRMGLNWGAVANEAFSTWIAVDQGEGFEAVEVGATWAYAWDDEAPLEPLVIEGGVIPDGALITRAAIPLDPSWIQP